MGEMAKFPYLTSRRGTNNLYYKRLVPLELRAAGRPEQIWRSLGTSDRKKAEAAYGAKHAEVEALFGEWRQDDTQPVGSVHCQLPAKGASNFVPLTPALLRRLSDAHYVLGGLAVVQDRYWVTTTAGAGCVTPITPVPAAPIFPTQLDVKQGVSNLLVGVNYRF
jgi:hypothetical protein